jgi:pectin methylesterase-like acyl-CoA thioesterase
MTLQRIIALLVAGILLTGCASSTLRSTWRDETDLGTTPRKLVVFVSVKDDNLRRMAENRVLQSIPRAPAPRPATPSTLTRSLKPTKSGPA